MMAARGGLLPTLLLMSAIALLQQQHVRSQSVMWTSSPVMPGQTILLSHTGTNTSGAHAVKLCTERAGRQRLCAAMAVKQTDSSTFVTVPASWPLGVFNVSLGPGPHGSAAVNSAEPWWFLADHGRIGTAAAVGWLRIFGRALAFSATRCVSTSSPLRVGITTSLRLLDVSNSSEVWPVPIATASCYDLLAQLPAEVPPGIYTVQVRNGLSSPHGSWSTVPGTLTIEPPPPAQDMRLSARDATQLLRALDTARDNLGGIVTIPNGVTIELTNEMTLRIPNNTVLRGEAGAAATDRPTLRWTSATGSASIEPLVSGTVTIDGTLIIYIEFAVRSPVRKGTPNALQATSKRLQESRMLSFCAAQNLGLI
jgi:hypothetical protein